jgi:hypothetical protein
MTSAAAKSLSTANRNLHAGLARLSPEPNPSAPLRPQDLSGLLMELLRTGDCLRSIAPASAPDAELENAISDYRSIVERLAEILPRIHGRLLTEKARLEIARAHVTAAAAWAKASQNTL